MDLRLHGCLMWVALASAGCGARSALDLGAEPGRPGTIRDATAPVDVVWFEAGPSDAPLPDAPAAPTSQCAVGATGVTTPIAAVNAGGAISFIDGRGHVTAPYTFPPPMAGAYRMYAEITSRGGYVAALVVDTPGTYEGTSSVAVALLDLGGNLLFGDTYSMPYQDCGGGANLVGNGSGLFVASVASCTTNLGVTFSPAGGRSWTDGYVAVGDPDSSGALVVNKNGNSTVSYWWYSATEQRFFPTAFVGELASQPVFYGPWLVYASVPPFDGGAPERGAMWLETAAGRTRLPTGGDGWGKAYVSGLAVANDGPGGVACWGAATTTTAQLFRVATTGDASAPFTLLAPAGASIWSPGYPTSFDTCPGVDSAGQPFQLFGLPSGAAQAFRLVPEGWQSVGAPMGAIASTSTLESGGTYLIGGSTTGGVPPIDPEGGAGVILGSEVQVVRPSSGASVTLPSADWTNQTYPAYFMTKDGGCVAYFEGGALTLADARAGVVHTTALTVDTSNLDLSLGWTNVPGDGQVYFGLGD